MIASIKSARKGALFALAATLILVANGQTGTRCGDAYRPDMTAIPVSAR